VKIEGSQDFQAPREQVFRALVDPELVTDALPGVGKVDVRDADHWEAEVKVPLPRAPRLRMSFELVERRPPERARLRSSGKSFGGGLHLDTQFDLTESAAGVTTMRYVADVQLTGLLGRLPDATVQPAAKQMVNGMLRAVERRVAKK
jgi:carbon monoxide dehydrogenase subunit G